MKKKIPAPMDDYGSRARARLDEWGRVFMVGAMVGALVTVGLIWAITEPLR
jgi:hypothetical protein